jgi:glycosyltransferase involved in cell wall biosynthesis
MARSLARLWRVLDEVDCVWALGPHPLALAFAALAALRRRRVVLGVRQDYPEYVRSRHPGRRLTAVAARALDRLWTLAARFVPVIVVGPALAGRYSHSRSVLEVAVSLVREGDVVPAKVVAERPYDGELTVLSVGRLESEKNPLLLADALARLREHDPRWRLVICGEGALEGDLRERLEQLGLTEHADLRGYVPLDRGLREAYRSSHALLHVSWTEGLPQVLLEAFAAALPVVATDVGGVAAFRDAVQLVPPGDADAAALELGRLAADDGLRARLVEKGRSHALAHTLEHETLRVAKFLRDQPSGP